MQHIDLETFANGAFTAQVNRAIEEVTKNIQDPNTDATAARKITVTIGFKPNQDRTLAPIGIQSKTTLAPALGAVTAIQMAKDLVTGEIQAAEIGNQIPGQMSMEDMKMFEELKDAFVYVAKLKEESMEPIVKTIDGKTYCNKSLVRYGEEDLADPIRVNTLSALVDYIKGMPEELRDKMILHIVSPKEVKLYSGLLEEKHRETLFKCEAIVNEFRFDKYYDQERFLIELQANFVTSEDLETIMKVSGNIQAGTTASYSDDGVSQKTTIKSGVQRADVIVPNPVKLVPYRTFSEVEQPSSLYVFRIRDDGGEPMFKLVEADNGLWKNAAMKKIKEYFEYELAEIPILKEGRLTIIA